MSISGGNISESHEYGLKIGARIRKVYGSFLAPRRSRIESDRSHSPLGRNSNDSSNRSIDKKSFLIKRSNSKAKTFLENDEKTVELNTRPIRIVDRSTSRTEKKGKFADETQSNRTITTNNDQYLRRLAELNRQSHMPNTKIMDSQSNRKSLIHTKLERKSGLSVKDSKLYSRLDNTYKQNNVDSNNDAIKIELPSPSRSDKKSSKMIRNIVEGEKQFEVLVRKVPKRKPLVLKNFEFKKKRMQGKCNVNLALQSRLKQSYISMRDQFSFELFLCQRMLITLTKTKPSQIEKSFRSTRIISQREFASPTLANRRFVSNDSDSRADDNHINGRDSSDDQDSIDEDFKGFDYNRKYKGEPSFPAAVYSNLEDAIQGQINFSLTYWDLNLTVKYLGNYSAVQFFSRLDILNRWYANGSTLIKKDSATVIKPDAIVKTLDIDLIIRDKTAKRFQAIYMQENGKINNDTFENVTLWGYQIQKLLSRDFERDFNIFKPGCSIPLELRILNHVLIRQLATDSQDMNSSLVSRDDQSAIDFGLDLNPKPDIGSQHEYLHKVEVFKNMLSASMTDNIEYMLDRFFDAETAVLRQLWEKRTVIGDFDSMYKMVEDCLDQQANAKKPRTKVLIPQVIINQIEDCNNVDIDLLMNRSEINSSLHDRSVNNLDSCIFN
jgi:hypothetical protein